MYLNGPRRLDKILKFSSLEMAKNAFKLFTKVEKFLKIRYLKWPIFYLFHTYSNNYKASSFWPIMEIVGHYGNKDACPYFCRLPYYLYVDYLLFTFSQRFHLFSLPNIVFISTFWRQISIFFQRIIKATRQLTHSIKPIRRITHQSPFSQSKYCFLVSETFTFIFYFLEMNQLRYRTVSYDYFENSICFWSITLFMPVEEKIFIFTF